MIYAVVENEIVTNVVESNIQLNANWIAVPINSPVSIGDKYINGCFYDKDDTMKQSPELQMATNRIAELETQNQVLVEKNQELTNQNEMLTACVLEMSEFVYA